MTKIIIEINCVLKDLLPTTTNTKQKKDKLITETIKPNSVQQNTNAISTQKNIKDSANLATEAVKQYNISSFKNKGNQIYGQLPDGSWVPVDRKGNPIEQKTYQPRIIKSFTY